MLFKAFSILCSGGHFVEVGSYFTNFGRGSTKDNFFEIILKSGHWPKRRCHLKVFLF